MLRVTVKPPPSANSLFVNLPHGHGRAKSKAYKNWLTDSLWKLRMDTPISGVYHDRAVSVRYLIPFNNRRDLGNYEKPLSDLLQAAGIFQNDKQIKRILLEWVDGEHCILEISSVEEEA